MLTGHANGLITINIAEADDVERERRRQQLHEPYRTLLGHFRHEVGHYYWDRLIKDNSALDTFANTLVTSGRIMHRLYKTTTAKVRPKTGRAALSVLTQLHIRGRTGQKRGHSLPSLDRRT